MIDNKENRSPRNKTLTISENEKELYAKNILNLADCDCSQLDIILNKTIHADLFEALDLLPKKFADLIIIDPPYNLDRNFHGFKFKSTDEDNYLTYLRTWFSKLLELLKDNGSLYLCGDWKSSVSQYQVMNENMTVINRITWQREKGRGAKQNWKNGMEDIWFGVKNKNNYYFDIESVKQTRRVVAPYRKDGKPKDWEETADGNFRLTHPSNFWDDISVPYWSMPENTDHPTQKPEKLIAKLILASSPEGGVIFDPFLGSGTTSVVAKKLGRNFVGIESNHEYCLWAEKRLAQADLNKEIQGYVDGVFWERNTAREQNKRKKSTK